MTLSSRERVEGALIGLLVGDALGVPYEFHLPSSVPPPEAIEMAPPAGFRRSHPGTPPGTWSDDGAHALCLLASLLHADRLDAEDLGRRLRNWHDHGYLAVDNRVFDIGNQTARALAALERGVPAAQAGGRAEHDNGNGSLMRVLPLALWHQGSDTELVADAHAQSSVTHGHPWALAACAIYVLWARRLLQGHADPWGSAVVAVRRIYTHPVLQDALEHVLGWETPKGTGFVVDALHSARAAVEAGPYEVAVRRAIAFGHDTDTTACIAGGIAGLRDGATAIPERWRAALRGRELLDPLLEALLARQAA